MSATRRGFLGAILAAAVAPAFVKAGVLMPVRQPIWTQDPIASLILGRHDSMNIGDIITIAGVKGADGRPMRFKVTGDVTNGRPIQIQRQGPSLANGRWGR